MKYQLVLYREKRSQSFWPEPFDTIEDLKKAHAAMLAFEQYAAFEGAEILVNGEKVEVWSSGLDPSHPLAQGAGGHFLMQWWPVTRQEVKRVPPKQPRYPDTKRRR